MKKYLLSLLIAVSISTANEAQIGGPVFSREINAPRLYGGQQRGIYYFLPDIDVYYYTPTREFVYLNNGEWFFSRSLPARYNGFDFYNCYKIRINAERPYLDNDYYQKKYVAYHGVQYSKYNTEALAENYPNEENKPQSTRERYKNWYNNFRRNNSTNDPYITREERTNNTSPVSSYPDKNRDNYQSLDQPKQERKNLQKQADDFDPYVETTPRENYYVPSSSDVNETRVKIPAPVVAAEPAKPAPAKVSVSNMPVAEKPATIKPQPLPVTASQVQDSSAVAKPVPAGQRAAYGSWDKKKPTDQ